MKSTTRKFKRSLSIGAYVLFLLALMVKSIGLQAAASDNGTDVKAILERYAKDYETDVTFTKDVTFGVKVGETFWTVVAKVKKEDAPASVKIIEGKPADPTYYFFTDAETLKKIDEGTINALTASAKAFETDFAPFDVDVMEGYQPNENFMADLLSVYFHFWTRGMPEVIPFGIDMTRTTHGAQAAVFYYQPGFRSAYVAIKKGQHANKDEKSKTNPFPSMLVIIKGEGIAIINGKTLTIKAGQSIVIPPGVTHEFLNPENDQPLEGILLMFGEGA